MLGSYDYRNVRVLVPGDEDYEDDGHLRVSGEQRWRVGVVGPNWHQFTARIDLLRISLASENPLASERIWDLSDGYGEQGYLPPQGWDWSGIRDSSPEAIRNMDALASEFISTAELADLLGLSRTGLVVARNKAQS